LVGSAKLPEVMLRKQLASGPSQAARGFSCVEHTFDLINNAGEFDRHHDQSIQVPL
jgi:hypothetical protein